MVVWSGPVATLIAAIAMIANDSIKRSPSGFIMAGSEARLMSRLACEQEECQKELALERGGCGEYEKLLALERGKRSARGSRPGWMSPLPHLHYRGANSTGTVWLQCQAVRRPAGSLVRGEGLNVGG